MFSRRKNEDFASEIETHIRLEADRNRESGMSEEEALTAARRAFGNVTCSRERFYESRRWLGWDAGKMCASRRDSSPKLRDGPRPRRWPSRSASEQRSRSSASSIRSCCSRCRFHTRMKLYAVIESMKLGDFGVAPDYFTMRENLRASIIKEMAAYDSSGVNWTGSDRAERLVAGQVTGSFFSRASDKAALRQNVLAGGRAAGRAKGCRTQLRIVAPKIRRRQSDCRPDDPAGPLPGIGDRRHAAAIRFPQRLGTVASARSG
jgi:hypothetical protein